MRILFLLLMSILLAMAGPAEACISSGPDGYTSGLVWDNKPLDVPDGAIVLKLSKIQFVPDSWIFTGLVEEGPRPMVGRRHRFVPMNLNSCVGFGAEQGFVAVLRKPVALEMDDRILKVLEVIDYKPTTLNEVSRLIFGGSQWRYPGEPSDRFMMPE